MERQREEEREEEREGKDTREEEVDGMADTCLQDEVETTTVCLVVCFS